jgi:1-acyl-sn-glycerol-3-phosphate acyltransferase
MGERPDPLAGAMRQAVRLLVRRGLRGVWLRGAPPPGPFVWAANHHTWWDPFLAMALLHRLRRRYGLLMRQDNLERYRFARRLGVFGTAEHRHGLTALRRGRVLIIYPEGGMRPAGGPGELAEGAAWYAARAPAPLVAAAARVLLRGHQHPEAYVWLARVGDDGPVGPRTAALARRLAGQLAAVDRLNATTDPRVALPGFTRMLAGRRSAEDLVDTLRRRR